VDRKLAAKPPPGNAAILTRADFPRLIDALRAQGYAVIGPRLAGGAICYEPIESAEDLPAGWGDTQDSGTYRAVRRDDDALFGYTAGAQSWKRHLFRPTRKLWEAVREGDDFAVHPTQDETPRYAFLGMRACELKAIAVQDHVFLRDGITESDYAARREHAFFIAVNCGEAGGTCFCTSMGSGPRADSGYDLALTELIDETRHVFLLEIGSARGAEIAKALPLTAATDADRAAVDGIVANTSASMGRMMRTEGIKALLQGNAESPQWDEVATRCLSCANCTFVCPTCFCHTEEDVTDLDGIRAERRQRWDSCFTMEFTHLPGGSVRPDVKTRYRHWITHKLANWYDQFGESGCVGCGRCITWCPAGIDITEEVARLRGQTEEA
jgi:ferredoxin